MDLPRCPPPGLIMDRHYAFEATRESSFPGLGTTTPYPRRFKVRLKSRRPKGIPKQHTG